MNENVPQLVAGSVVMAFEEVCPERIDLIHKNYRKLCNLLIDVEEWGQVVIINMLTRYARTQFLNPNINVSQKHRQDTACAATCTIFFLFYYTYISKMLLVLYDTAAYS